MEKEISIVIRVMPNADDVDVTLPLNATATDVIETLVGDPSLGIPRIDQQGNPISYKLAPKGKNRELGEDETLGHGEVQDGDILLMMPVVIAGAFILRA
ncbi:MAG: EsaB/YukD family protein [Saprospiraceae bacterium]|nr:EsaB/YukD family protein [Saprospiraceae bacterium]